MSLRADSKRQYRHHVLYFRRKMFILYTAAAEVFRNKCLSYLAPQSFYGYYTVREMANQVEAGRSLINL